MLTKLRTDKVVATTPKIGTRISFGGIVSFIMSNRFGLKRKVAPNPITFDKLHKNQMQFQSSIPFYSG